MAKIESMIPQNQSAKRLEGNEFINFIRKERNNVIQKVKSQYPSISEDQIKDIFQNVCIMILDKSKDKNFHLTCSLFYYVYRCCRFMAEHASRHIGENVPLPPDNFLNDVSEDGFEPQPVKQEKVDGLLDILFNEDSEREELLDRVCEVVKDLPEPCNKILYGMYSTPRKKQAEIARECGYSNASVVKTMASRCKSKFKERFSAIYNAFKKGK